MTSRGLLILLTAAASLAAAGFAPEPEATADPYAVVRGMTISCPGAGQIWGTDAMVQTMQELRDLGCNWITIHPYARIGADGTVGGSRMGRLYADPVWLTRPIKEAHRLGLKIMIKPHIAYWGSPFSWRGEIAFDTEDEWRRFFETYEQWIAMVADIAADADAFVVGTELDRTVHHEADWRRIIATVRARTDAPLTYAANWDSFERVEFWDALDVIGLQSYFPLVGHENVPTESELRRGWDRLLGRLREYSVQHDRRIILAELGYNRATWAAARPWDHRSGGDGAEETQRRCMQVALEAIDDSDVVVGAFLWKWFPGERRWRGNFLMSTPSMREIIRGEWGANGTPPAR
ncbi:MAG: glycoside hydrolase family 113 [Planctomycetota bacterium]|jgi:hypothetical protein